MPLLEHLTYDVKALTPIFSKGFENVELRPASFNGSMRFWYRAVLAEDNLKKLHDKEEELFGSTEKAAKMAIRITDKQVIKDKYYLMPHKKEANGNPVRRTMIYPDTSFTLKFTIRDETILDKAESFIRLFLLLGSVGQRSRRGLGSFWCQNEGFSFTSKKDFLNEVGSLSQKVSGREFEVTEDKLEFREDKEYSYPVIKNITLGDNFDEFEDLLEDIGEASHKNSDSELGDFRLGRSGRRMASPLYITAKKIDDKLCPVMTRLEAVYPEDFTPTDPEGKIKDFIKELR